MNPASRETSGISLPPPVAEQAPGQAGNAQSAPEQGPSAPETAQRPAAAQPAAILPAVPAGPAPVPAQSRQHNDDTSTTRSVASPLLNDNDKVEKEWVDKIKRIIAQLQHDPHKQSEELTLLKADYMKQRYNKIIKVEK